MRKLDFSTNFLSEMLNKVNIPSKTSRRTTHLTTRNDNESIIANPAMHSFRDARNCITKHKVGHNNTIQHEVSTKTEYMMKENINKVSKLEAEWNHQKSTSPLKRPTYEFTTSLTQSKSKYFVPFNLKNQVELHRSCYSPKKNDLKYELSYLNETDNKYEESLGNNRLLSANTKHRTSLPTLSFQNPKTKSYKQIISPHPQTYRDEEQGSENINIDNNRSISKQQLNILGRILPKKAGFPVHSKSNHTQELSSIDQLEKTKNTSIKDISIKDISINLSKIQAEYNKSRNYEMKSNGSLKVSQTQSKLHKTSDYRDHREKVESHISPMKSKENKSSKKTLNYRKGISPIFVKVDLPSPQVQDFQEKENKFYEASQTARSNIGSRHSNMTPTKQAKIKSPLRESIKSIEKGINVDTLKSKLPKYDPKKKMLNQYQETLSQKKIETVKVLKIETPNIKSPRYHGRASTERMPLQDKSGYQSQRELKKGGSSQKELFRKLEPGSPRLEIQLINERDQLYNQIVQRLNKEKSQL